MEDKSPAPVVPLSRLRAALARPRGARRVDALISETDAEAAIAALSVPDLFFLIKEVGLEDSLELVAMMTPEQFQGCLDLDIWDRDALQTSALLPWLTCAVEAGYEKVAELWDGLDPELSALFIARAADIYDKSLEEEAPEDDERPRLSTPDSFFELLLRGDGDQAALVARLIADLYRADPVGARYSLMAARSELESELEELSYRWRSGRLADLGYADFYDALEVFRPLDPASVRIGEGSVPSATEASRVTDGEARELPAPLLDQIAGRAFLARALERIHDAAEIDRLQAALMILVNKVLAAARVSPGDPEALSLGTLHATATLALGLEHIAGGELARAEDALRSVSLTRLHRLGYSISLQLGRLARLLLPRAATAGEPSGSVLAALLGRRPFFAAVLEGGAAGEVRPFESRADIARAAEHLRELALRVAIAESLGIDLVAASRAPEPRPELDDYVRSALLRLAAGGELDPAPLAAAEIEAGAARLAEGGLSADAREALADSLGRALAKSGVEVDLRLLTGLVRRWIGELEETLGGVGGAVDPRFVGGIVTVADKS